MYDYEIIEESFRQDGYYVIKVKCWDGAKTDAQEYIVDCVYGKRRPSDVFLKGEINRRVLKLENDIINPPVEPERPYMADEVTAILKERGYLKEGEKFSEDMPDKKGM